MWEKGTNLIPLQNFKSEEKWISALKCPSCLFPKPNFVFRFGHFTAIPKSYTSYRQFFARIHPIIRREKERDKTRTTESKDTSLHSLWFYKTKLPAEGIVLFRSSFGPEKLLFPSYRYLYLIYFSLLLASTKRMSNQRSMPFCALRFFFPSCSYPSSSDN